MQDAIAEVFESAGARGFMHARGVDAAVEVGVEADALVALASVFKIPVLVELARQVDRKRLDWTGRVHIPARRRTMGPTGLSVMIDDVDLSLRDLAFWMMSVSDNTATDVIMEILGGADVINKTMADFGLARTHIVGDCDFLLTALLAELGVGSDGAGLYGVTREQVAACRGLQPEGTSRSTPREITTLLSMIWRDEAASPAACAEMRRIMGLQVWPHRLTSGFPDGVSISAKTGTLTGGIRNEAGVVELANGHRYAVAVFTRAHQLDYRLPAVDASIGAAARLAVTHLESTQLN
jgi:beta-lactamase class A